MLLFKGSPWPGFSLSFIWQTMSWQTMAWIKTFSTIFNSRHKWYKTQWKKRKLMYNSRWVWESYTVKLQAAGNNIYSFLVKIYQYWQSRVLGSYIIRKVNAKTYVKYFPIKMIQSKIGFLPKWNETLGHSVYEHSKLQILAVSAWFKAQLQACRWLRDYH